MRTERGFDRIVNFSDATVAIAMTLLVLPLVDIGGETGQHESLWELLEENYYTIFAFILSFLVIWSMWVNHHRVMEFFADYDSRMMRLHLVWLLTVVSIPFTTELIANPDFYMHGGTALYVAVLLVTSLALHLLGAHGRRHPELLHDDRDEVKAWLAAPYTWTTVIVMAAILVIVLIAPWMGAWPLLLLVVDGPVERWFLHRRSPARA